MAPNKLNSLKEIFIKACFDKNMSKVKACIELDVDINVQVPDEDEDEFMDKETYGKLEGYSGLHIAIMNDDVNLLELLLSNPNINVNVRNEREQTPILYLLQDKPNIAYYNEVKLEFLKMLLAKDSLNLDVKDFIGTHLTHALMMCDMKIIRELIHNDKMKWNVKNRSEETPIQIALKNDNEEVFRILCKNKAVDKTVLPKIVQRFAVKRRRVEGSECPVCFNSFEKDQQIYQCSKGHFICQDCDPQVQECPTCRSKMIGRAFGFEKFLTTLNSF